MGQLIRRVGQHFYWCICSWPNLECSVVRPDTNCFMSWLTCWRGILHLLNLIHNPKYDTMINLALRCRFRGSTPISTLQKLKCPGFRLLLPGAKFAKAGHPRLHLLPLVEWSYSSIIKPPRGFPWQCKSGFSNMQSLGKKKNCISWQAARLCSPFPPCSFSPAPFFLICLLFYLLAKVRQAWGDQSW